MLKNVEYLYCPHNTTFLTIVLSSQYCLKLWDIKTFIFNVFALSLRLCNVGFRMLNMKKIMMNYYKFTLKPCIYYRLVSYKA